MVISFVRLGFKPREQREVCSYLPSLELSAFIVAVCLHCSYLPSQHPKYERILW